MSIFKRKSDSASGGQIRRELNPDIKLEKQVSEQIYNSLQGDIVKEILLQLKSSESDTWWRSNMEGHSLKVAKELLPDMYALCTSVKAQLGFEAPVDFYITGDSTVNAFSVASEIEGEPNIVNINSGLLSLMTEDELRFVIGHELGHLINKDTSLTRLISFVFPEGATTPLTLQYKIRLHSQLAELVADRYGYMAVGNLDACVTAFFKMASGLDLEKMNVSIGALLEDNLKHLEYFLNDKGVSRATHPVNPIRIHAINLFAKAKSQKELDEGMDELVSILLKVGTGELDEYIARFMATAGLIVANADDQVTQEEVDSVVEELSALKIFPMNFLEEISHLDIMEVFNEAVNKIMEVNPGLREGLFNYMVSIVLSDKNIKREELECITGFGRNIGFSDIEMATMLAKAIQQSFVPSLASIC